MDGNGYGYYGVYITLIIKCCHHSVLSCRLYCTALYFRTEGHLTDLVILRACGQIDGTREEIEHP